ncbi:MAG: SulP family inorganic anion transporter [Anaerolineae bacterium]|nr:MAG: SulP family inorganic anion transporter [Anaerolineae bacterium]
MAGEISSQHILSQYTGTISGYLTRPIRSIRTYERSNLRPDITAGLTVAVILLPQAIAFALIVELPPVMGLYTAIIAGVFGALWGSSNQNHTGPTNAISLLVLSVLSANFIPGTAQFIVAAGMLALMVGVIQLLLGLARLGLLVNFVSHSVIIGFAAGAGVLIALRQIPSLIGVPVTSGNLAKLEYDTFSNLGEVNQATFALGLLTIAIILILHRINKRIPASLIAMALASILVLTLSLDKAGVVTIGPLPSKLPPLAELPLLDFSMIRALIVGALAVGAIGLVETSAISRSIANQTGQRLDSNQEFVGQGLANIASGFFSGYPGAGSFSRSAINFDAGAKSGMAAVFSSMFVLLAMFGAASLGAYLPRSTLSGVLIVVAIGMIDRKEIIRIWRGPRGDAAIMLVTFLGTLFLDIAFAVLAGILLSFGRYIIRTSTPRVHQVLPVNNFRHFSYQPDNPICPQLGVMDILGDMYFGAVYHIEDAIHHHLEKYPDQRFLLLRMHNVNNCDFSGIHMLESVVKSYRERSGDVYMVRVGYRVNQVMESTGFQQTLGEGNFLQEDRAIKYLFHKVLDPAVCIYECPVRVFSECQNLPKQLYPDLFHFNAEDYIAADVPEITPEELWERMRNSEMTLNIFDIREPREYRRGHIPHAQLLPLPKILTGTFPKEAVMKGDIILVCRTGRRSRRAALKLVKEGINATVLDGGMIAWEAADLLEAVDI